MSREIGLIRWIALGLMWLCLSTAARAQTASDDRAIIDAALADMGGYFRSAEQYRMLPGTYVGVTLHGPTSAYVSDSGATIPLCTMTNVELFYAPGDGGTSNVAPGQALRSLSEERVFRLAFDRPGREAPSQELADVACMAHATDHGWFRVSGIEYSQSEFIRETANASVQLVRGLAAGADSIRGFQMTNLVGEERAISALRTERPDRLARLAFSDCEDTNAYWCDVVQVRFGECGNVTELTMTLHRPRPNGAAQIADASVRTLVCMI